MKINYNWNNKAYNDFITYLEKISDEKTKAFNSKIINTKYEILGIKTPILKLIAKDISKTNIDEFIKLSGTKYYEEVLICGFVLSYIKDENKFIDYFNDFLIKIDCWALCDSCISSYKIFKKGDFSAYCYSLILDSREYYVRAGYVILLNYYVDDEHISDILSLCLKESPYYYVNMAISWLIQVCFIKYRVNVLELLKSKKLSPFVQNKAIAKIRESLKVSKEDKELVKKYLV